jgi:hypothetical protein
MPLFARRTVEVSWVVAFLQFVATSQSDEEDRVYLDATEMRGRFGEIAQKQVAETLGPEFEVIDLHVRRGSAVILVVVATIGTVVMTFSRYESFVKSLNLWCPNSRD